MLSFKKIYQFIRYDIWHRTGEEFSLWRRIGFLTLRTIILSVRGFMDDQLNIRANALTYSMIFALVPILAAVLAIAKGFGFEGVIESYLQNSALGDMGVVPALMGIVQRYLDTTQNGVFLGIGLLILLWSVYWFFQNIEQDFNDIWQVKNSRNVGKQIMAYLSILLLIPIVLVVSSGLSMFVHSTLAQTRFFDAMTPLWTFFIKLLPFILCWLIFSLLYWAVPNTKVKFWSAVIPGVIIGTLFELLQMLSFLLLAFLSRTSLVYGAFAALPILLFWLQLTCLFLLVGAELSFAIQNNEEFDYEQDIKFMSRRYKDCITFYLAYKVVKRFEQQLQPQTAHEIAKENHIPTRLVNQLLGRLTESKILIEISSDELDDRTFVPAFDINKLTVGKVFDAIGSQGNENFLNKPSDELKTFWGDWVGLLHTNRDFDNILVKDLVEPKIA
ncbi:MAG: YihY/virulence factor BrkB family protein [Paludibacteraceae bacterium]|nr:YihY/virulence factor BrkB family protein [Paludibacteraceae bacterium]